MIKLIIAASLLIASAFAPARALAACIQKTTGLKLCIPSFNDDGDIWGNDMVVAFSSVNAIAMTNSSTSIGALGVLAVSTITGNATGQIYMSSDVYMTSPKGLSVTYGVTAGSVTAGAITINAAASGIIDAVNTDLYLRRNGSPGNVIFAPNNASETVRFQANGSVGIGTASPGTTIDVNGKSTFRDAMTVASSMTVTGAGGSFAVTPGSNPGFNLDASATFIRNSGTGVIEINSGNPAWPLVLNKTSGGNVGIGTANPATKLHMSSGTLTIDGAGAGLRLSNIASGTQCLQADASGNVTGTGSACGGASNAVLTATQTFSGGNTFSGQVTVSSGVTGTINVSSYTFLPGGTFTTGVMSVCLAQSTVTFATLGNVPIDVKFNGTISYNSTHESALSFLMDGAFVSPMSATVAAIVASPINTQCHDANFAVRIPASLVTAGTHSFCLVGANNTGAATTTIVGTTTKCPYESAFGGASQFGAGEAH